MKTATTTAAQDILPKRACATCIHFIPTKLCRDDLQAEMQSIDGFCGCPASMFHNTVHIRNAPRTTCGRYEATAIRAGKPC